MRTTIALSLVASLTGSAAAQVESYFGVMVAHSGSPINFIPMQARGLSLYVIPNGRYCFRIKTDNCRWIGGNSAHYCPTGEDSACPNTTVTNFLGGIGELTMGAIVSGWLQAHD